MAKLTKREEKGRCLFEITLLREDPRKVASAINGKLFEVLIEREETEPPLKVGDLVCVYFKPTGKVQMMVRGVSEAPLHHRSEGKKDSRGIVEKVSLTRLP